METSPNNFHGTGVNRKPAVTPAPPTSKSRLETFMVAPLLMTTETANLDLVATMAAFAIGHLHAIVRSAPETRNGMAPNVAAIAADAVLLVNPSLVGFPIISMAVGASQTCAARMDRMREPDIRGLAGIDEPTRFSCRFQIAFDENGFRL
jgi:hypothetical protein